jgi:membrane protein implicated in regulation of membrane protease activity
MPLSENEQRLLEQIERALVEDDPKFASAVRSTNPRTYLARRIRRNAVLFVLGLAMLVVGVVLSQLPALTVTLGILGFAIMLTAALRGAADLRRLSNRGTDSRRGAGPARRRTRATLMERFEERWRRRWEG